MTFKGFRWLVRGLEPGQMKTVLQLSLRAGAIVSNISKCLPILCHTENVITIYESGLMWQQMYSSKPDTITLFIISLHHELEPQNSIVSSMVSSVHQKCFAFSSQCFTSIKCQQSWYKTTKPILVQQRQTERIVHVSLDVFSSTVCPSNTADADAALSGLLNTQAASGFVTVLY